MSLPNPIVHINGAAQSAFDARDRGLAYGDGLFETCRVFGGRIPLWQQHTQRLYSSLKNLKISIDNNALESFIKLILDAAKAKGCNAGVLKVMVTRGLGGRGYRMPESPSANILLYFYPDELTGFNAQPEPVELGLCRMLIGRNPTLAGHKHLNRLENVLARSEWAGDRIIDSILRDSEGLVVECTAHNIFMLVDNTLVTPALDQCGVKGVMRELIRTQLSRTIGMHVVETTLTLKDLQAADAIFICNSNCGIRPVAKILDENGLSLKTFSDHAIAWQLQNALLAQVVKA